MASTTEKPPILDIPDEDYGDISTATMLDLYYYIRLAREMELRLINLFKQNKVVGGLYPGYAHEATTVGTALAGVLLGFVADRLGTHRVVQIVTWCQFTVPALALLFHLGVFGPATGLLFPLLYVLLGIFDGSVR